MGKFEKLKAALEALPEQRREEIAAIVEALFHGDLNPSSRLTDAQITEVEARLADPGPVATAEEVDSFFARLTA